MAFLRRQFVRLHANFMKIAWEVVSHGGKIGFEWPTGNALWKEPCVTQMVKTFDLQVVKFNGCQVGLRSRKGIPILKPWTIKSNCKSILAQFHDRICGRDGAHDHDSCTGGNTAASAHYPKEMADMIHEGIRIDVTHKQTPEQITQQPSAVATASGNNHSNDSPDSP